jgi:hypothetical protein
LDNFKKHLIFNLLSKTCWALAFIALGLVGYTYLVGNTVALPWLTDITYIKTPLFKEYFTIEGKPMGFSLDQIVNWQHYKTGRYRFLEAPHYFLFGIITICYLVISVTITYLERFWFMVCSGILVFVSINLGLDQIGIMNEYLAYIFIGLVLLVSYYFNSFKPDAAFTTRLLSFFLVFLSFWLVVLFIPTAEPAAFFIPSYGLFSSFILVTLFIFFVSGDNCFYLFKIATQNAPTGKNALIHFLVIGGIYVLLLFLLFLDLTGWLSLDLILIDPYTLLMASTVAGYFILTTKLEVVASVIPFELIKKVLFPVLAAITFALIYYAEITANDSLITAIQFSIIIPHLAFGLVFYAYAFINFTPDLLSNEVAWPSFFKGERASLLMARIATVFLVVALFSFLEFKPYYQLKAGQYNSLGLLAEKSENDLLASQYYKQAIFYDYASVTANYSSGMLEKTVDNASQVTKRFKNASIRSSDYKPELALTQYYSDNDQLFNKLLSLKEIKNASSDLKVMNNLAIAHYEFGQLDTAYYLMEKAMSTAQSAVTIGNMLALDLSILESINVDSVLQATAGFSELPIKINHQALANTSSISSNFQLELSSDSVLVIEELYYLFNTAIGPNQKDQSLLEAIDYYSPFERNITIKDYLLLAKAIQQYNFGAVNKAFNTLNDLMAYDQRKAGLYSYIKSIWAFHQQAPNQAIVLLAQAEAYNFDRAIIADTYQAFLKRTIDNPAEQLKQQWKAYENNSSKNTQEEKIELLKSIAVQNAFDEAVTLKAMAELRALGSNTETLYELLQKSIQINQTSVLLYEQYIYETVESGLSMIGNSALEELSKNTTVEIYNQIRANFLAKIETRAKQALNIK